MKRIIALQEEFSGGRCFTDGDMCYIISCCSDDVANVKQTEAPSTPASEKFESASLFLKLGLTSTLIRHKNGASKTPALRFRVDGRYFENGGVTIIMSLPARLSSNNPNPKFLRRIVDGNI